MSLRARLLLGTLAIAAVLALSAVVITRSTHAHLIGQLDEQLHDAGPQLRPGRDGGLGGVGGVGGGGDQPGPTPD